MHVRGPGGYVLLENRRRQTRGTVCVLAVQNLYRETNTRIFL